MLVKKKNEGQEFCYNLVMKTRAIKFKKDLFRTLTDSIKKNLEAKGVKEEEILEDFEES